MDVLRSAKLTNIVGAGKLRRASGPGAGGEPRHCSSYHPRLPDSDFHDYGFSCSCRLTAEERRRQADERRALLAALWNSPGAEAERLRRQSQENELASWLAGQPDVVISTYGGWAPGSGEAASAVTASTSARHDCWRIEPDQRPSGRFVSTWRCGDLDDEGSYQPQEIRKVR
jgi:hypothetical protein